MPLTSSNAEIDLTVADERWLGAVTDLNSAVARAVKAALAVDPEPRDELVEVSVLLADDAAVQELNRIWRGKNEPTNVLSFPAPPQPVPPGAHRPVGDVVLAYDTMLRESSEQSKPLAHHLAHLLVHGTLHLLGQDHETGAAQAEAMETLEVAALRTLGIPDPYGE